MRCGPVSPAGTLSGAPKVRAMEIIEELEPARRGTYGGAVLYADFSGNLDSCIAIRSMLAVGGKGCVQAGRGLSPIPFRSWNIRNPSTTLSGDPGNRTGEANLRNRARSIKNHCGREGNQQELDPPPESETKSRGPIP